MKLKRNQNYSEMKLIDEKEIDTAALDYAEKEKYCKSEFDSFKSGFSFAEQIITPLMIEFTEWVCQYYIYLAVGIWIKKGLSSMHPDFKNYSTSYLLEEFLKTKQK